MKLSIIVSFSIISISCQAQFKSRNDSTGSSLPAHRPMNKSFHIESGSNIAMGTTNPALTPVEVEVRGLEEREIEALKKRDFVALTVLWARDFSGQDASTDQVVNSNSSLPYYTVLSRIIETVSSTDSTVFTRGIEQFQILGSSSKKMTDVQQRKFSHTWTKKDGIWKLTSKINGKM